MSCALCRLARTACDRVLPCKRCVRLGMPERCFRPPSKRGRPARQAPSLGVPRVVNILPQACDSFAPPPTAPSSLSSTALPAPAAAATAPPTSSLPPPPPFDREEATTAPTQQQQQQQLPQQLPQLPQLLHVSTSAQPPASAAAAAAESQALSGATTGFLVQMVIALKEDMRAMTDKVHGMKKRVRGMEQLQGDVQEMQQRLQLLEDDNSQLRVQLAQVAASGHGVARYPCLASSSSTSSTSSLSLSSSLSSSSFAASVSSPKRRRVSRDDDDDYGGGGANGSNSGDGLSEEVLGCFPFLQSYNLSPSRFVVDDLQKAIVVITIPHGKKKSRWSTTFATHQFCDITGFSLAELLGQEFFSLVPRHKKLEFIHAWQDGFRVGVGDIDQYCFHLAHKEGCLVKVAARNQFFWSPDGQLTHAVICVDQVLARDYLPFSIEELRAREKEEWEEVGLEFAEEAIAQASALAVRGSHHNFDPPTLSPLIPPYTPTTPAEGAWHEFLLFEDNHSPSPSSSSSASSPPPLSGFFPPS